MAVKQKRTKEANKIERQTKKKGGKKGKKNKQRKKVVVYLFSFPRVEVDIIYYILEKK